MSKRGITFDDTNPNTPFIRNFIVQGLWKALTDFECGEFEASSFIDWFMDAARYWPVKKSQAEFSAYARDRLADKIGWTRRQLDAFNIIDRYFDKSELLTLDEVIEAVTFCVPSKKIPDQILFRNGNAVIVDVTKRKGIDKFLKVDDVFFPTLERLYPFERRDDKIIKTVPVGHSTREFDLATLAFWFRYRNANRDEMANAMTFHSADRLDWTSKNLFSRWRQGPLAERYANRVDPVPEDTGRLDDGTVFLKRPSASVIVRPAGDGEDFAGEAA